MPLPLPEDPAVVPAYSVAQVARYLKIPVTTVSYWVSRKSGPLVLAPWQEPPTLCFKNVVECHVLHALRTTHNVRMALIRSTINTLGAPPGARYPLADNELSTDGVYVYLEKAGALINVSRHGELAFKEIVGPYLKRIVRDPHSGAPVRLYPFLGVPNGASVPAAEDRSVMIDPRVCFGRAVLAGTRISTEVVAGRIRAGESVARLAAQYERSKEEIEAAVRFEARIQAA